MDPCATMPPRVQQCQPLTNVQVERADDELRRRVAARRQLARAVQLPAGFLSCRRSVVGGACRDIADDLDSLRQKSHP